MLLTHTKVSDSYTLDRNASDADDSLETSTDNHLDSMEHPNETSTENNSMEDEKRRLVKRNIQPVVSIVNHDYDDHDSIETTTLDDDLVDNVSLEDIVKQQTAVAIQTTTPDDDLVDSMEKNQTSTEDLIDSHTSLENNDVQAVPMPSASILNHLPVIGVYSHPASDDLYLTKKYLDDYYFWEMDDDSARDYFSQKVKDTTKLDFDSPIKVDAIQFTQFTPVRSLPTERLKASTIAL